MPAATSRKGKSRAAPAGEEKVQAVMPLGKQLAHTDKKVRDRAVASLVAFLSQGGDTEGESSSYVRLSDSEMAKLWKGLFYCFWMSDKPLVQQALAADLAELLLLIKPRSDSPEDRFKASLAFLEGFWDAIVREWAGIDRLRMDKYYLLMRRYVNATFRLLARESWRAEAVEAVNMILSKNGGPMTWEDRRVPTSIATHIADIYLDELDKALALPEVDSQPACPLTSVLQPHIALLTRTPTSTVHARLMSSIFTPLLESLALASPSLSLDRDEGEERPSKRSKKESKSRPMYAHIVMHSCIGTAAKSGTPQTTERATPEKLRSGLLKAMFVAAADEKAGESNRRKVYQVWREEGGGDDDDDEEDEE
ncbi:ribosomal RNA-processing protein 1 [Kwoniella heveanensis CBS 569]|uniref:Ribosomal RNA-processing protein 1 n=1 Tax=Kwoniella heveanensis BCC8398 TaxID=1296120 RepID=A0A1B9GRA9_9TREE|nr:ribosomal RNA-processing protein 1 [Kwoniella heveanensis BCC8398]OCF42601.1 ribosomal RNA-processing protein 1 [Kwoniella heveanensis CBS 569]